MKKLKRILIMAFIFAFALSQFESIHAESVEADMTDAKNAETVLADTKEELDAQADTELADRENAGAVLAGAQDVQDPPVAGCKTHAEAVEELTEAMDQKMNQLNTKNEDYTLRINKVEEPKDYQNPNPSPTEHVSHYQLSVTVINKEKTFSDIDMTGLAGLVNDLYKEGKIDRLKFTLNKDEGTNLKDELTNINDDEGRKAKISTLIKENLIKTMIIGDGGTKLGNITSKEGGVRLSKKACDNKEAFLWIRVPFRNAIVNEIQGKIEGKDITVNKNANVTWKDGVKIKDSVVDKEGYQKHIDHAKVEDISGRDTKTAGVKNGNIKLRFTDDTELTINQNLIVKRDHLDDELDRRQEEQRRQEERENYRKRNTRQERLKRQEKEDKEAKLEEKTVAKKEMKAKKDYGIVNATALKLVTHKDIPQGQSGEAITEMLRRGVLNGVSSAEFAPKLSITRAMLAQVLMNISTDKTVGMIELKDIKGDEWYADAITWAVTHGIFKGYPDGSFKAEQKLTREEVASVLYSFLKERGIDMPEVQDFTYADNVSAWSKEAVTKLAKLGLVNGKSETNYEAKSEFTREELAVALYKIINWVMSQSI